MRTQSLGAIEQVGGLTDKKPPVDLSSRWGSLRDRNRYAGEDSNRRTSNPDAREDSTSVRYDANKRDCNSRDEDNKKSMKHLTMIDFRANENEQKTVTSINKSSKVEWKETEEEDLAQKIKDAMEAASSSIKLAQRFSAGESIKDPQEKSFNKKMEQDNKAVAKISGRISQLNVQPIQPGGHNYNQEIVAINTHPSYSSSCAISEEGEELNEGEERDWLPEEIASAYIAEAEECKKMAETQFLIHLDAFIQAQNDLQLVKMQRKGTIQQTSVHNDTESMTATCILADCEAAFLQAKNTVTETEEYLLLAKSEALQWASQEIAMKELATGFEAEAEAYQKMAEAQFIDALDALIKAKTGANAIEKKNGDAVQVDENRSTDDLDDEAAGLRAVADAEKYFIQAKLILAEAEEYMRCAKNDSIQWAAEELNMKEDKVEDKEEDKEGNKKLVVHAINSKIPDRSHDENTREGNTDTGEVTSDFGKQVLSLLQNSVGWTVATSSIWNGKNVDGSVEANEKTKDIFRMIEEAINTRQNAKRNFTNKLEALLMAEVDAQVAHNSSGDQADESTKSKGPEDKEEEPSKETLQFQSEQDFSEAKEALRDAELNLRKLKEELGPEALNALDKNMAETSKTLLGIATNLMEPYVEDLFSYFNCGDFNCGSCDDSSEDSKKSIVSPPDCIEVELVAFDDASIISYIDEKIVINGQEETLAHNSTVIQADTAEEHAPTLEINDIVEEHEVTLEQAGTVEEENVGDISEVKKQEEIKMPTPQSTINTEEDMRTHHQHAASENSFQFDNYAEEKHAAEFAAVTSRLQAEAEFMKAKERLLQAEAAGRELRRHRAARRRVAVENAMRQGGPGFFTFKRNHLIDEIEGNTVYTSGSSDSSSSDDESTVATSIHTEESEDSSDAESLSSSIDTREVSIQDNVNSSPQHSIDNKEEEDIDDASTISNLSSVVGQVITTKRSSNLLEDAEQMFGKGIIVARKERMGNNMEYLYAGRLEIAAKIGEVSFITDDEIISDFLSGLDFDQLNESTSDEKHVNLLHLAVKYDRGSCSSDQISVISWLLDNPDFIHIHARTADSGMTAIHRALQVSHPFKYVTQNFAPSTECSFVAQQALKTLLRNENYAKLSLNAVDALGRSPLAASLEESATRRIASYDYDEVRVSESTVRFWKDYPEAIELLLNCPHLRLQGLFGIQHNDRLCKVKPSDRVCVGLECLAAFCHSPFIERMQHGPLLKYILKDGSGQLDGGSKARSLILTQRIDKLSNFTKKSSEQWVFHPQSMEDKQVGKVLQNFFREHISVVEATITTTPELSEDKEMVSFLRSLAT